MARPQCGGMSLAVAQVGQAFQPGHLPRLGVEAVILLQLKSELLGQPLAPVADQLLKAVAGALIEAHQLSPCGGQALASTRA